MTEPVVKLACKYINESIISGTHVPIDVFDACKPFLVLTMEGQELIDEFHGVSNEDCNEFVFGTVFDYMNDIAPRGTYFGAHPGNGSDFGFWEFDDEDEGDYLND